MVTPLYFTHGEVVAESNDITVYEMDGIRYLEQGPGHNLWMWSEELKDIKEQVANGPRGDCLEIGLGLGIASEYILSRPCVKSLTTVELNKDVVYVYYELNKKDDRHTIVCQNGLDFMLKSENKFDFIFLDMYSEIDEDSLPIIKTYVEATNEILKPNGEVMGWFDPFTPREFAEEFFKIFGALYIEETHEIL